MAAADGADDWQFDLFDPLAGGSDAHAGQALQVQALDPAAAAPVDLEARIARAESVLIELLRAGAPLCVAWSAGKDSSCVLNLTLVAAAKLAAQGEPVPPIVVTHAATGIDNPEVALYARAEMLQVREFARRHKLRVEIATSTPHLNDLWAVRVIGGRALPPFAGTNRDCATA